MKVTAEFYTQHLITSQVNYTCSYSGDRLEGISGDKIERYLKSAKLKPSMLWEKSKSDIIFSENGCLIFDDTVLDKNRSSKIEAVRKQWSGNQHRVIRGIGVVGCVYYNPQLNQTWLIDYRIFDPEIDGLKKTEHAMEMFKNIVHHKQIKIPNFKFKYTLFDAAYATKKFLALIDNTGNKYLCNMKANRTCWESGVDYSNKDKKLNNKPVQFKDLDWDNNSLQTGKMVRLKGFPVTKKMKLFKITVSTDRTDYIVTNDITIDNPDVIKEVNGMRWNIEGEVGSDLFRTKPRHDKFS